MLGLGVARVDRDLPCGLGFGLFPQKVPVMKTTALSCLVLAASGAAAHASSGDAWAEFQAEVAKVCLALPDAPKGAAVQVSPFGSESYGAALITWVEAGVLQQQVCIFDKVAHTAELAAPFAATPVQTGL
jgi:hypothetical protein